ncbi:MAG: hypothetical protein RLY70_2172 [Planctomycetota bacterium]
MPDELQRSAAIKEHCGRFVDRLEGSQAMDSQIRKVRRFWLVLGLSVAVWGSFPGSDWTPAQAARFESHGHVYHTRRLPVIVHRVFPPHLGRHVYLRHKR